MVDEKYKYLFPFEHIPRNSKVFIYGAGIMGQEYYRQLQITKYCVLLGFVDREWEQYKGSCPIVYSPNMAIKEEFDYIVISVKIATRAEVIKEDLLLRGVPEDKIIYILPRLERSEVFLSKIDRNEKYNLAYERNKISIAIRIGNGLGSAIIKKKIFEEMCDLIPEAIIDIYTMMKAEDIEALYGFEENFNTVIHESGSIYEINKQKYTISIRIPTSIIVDHVDYDELLKSAPNAVPVMKALVEFGKTDAGSDYRYPSAIHVARNIYLRKNCYTAYDCNGILNIDSMKVRMSLNEKWREKFSKLGYGCYITINYGNGQTLEKEHLVSKQWPYEYYCDFVKLVKEKWPNIVVVQVGANGARKLQGVDYSLLGENLELIKHVLSESLLHIDIEGGLVHLASQLGTTCAVLFGPTPIEFFGYPGNINIRAGTCHGCIGLYDNGYYCARGLEKPECMREIQPKMVLELIENKLKNLIV